MPFHAPDGGRWWSSHNPIGGSYCWRRSAVEEGEAEDDGAIAGVHDGVVTSVVHQWAQRDLVDLVVLDQTLLEHVHRQSASWMLG
jgi:hypothetical protein